MIPFLQWYENIQDFQGIISILFYDCLSKKKKKLKFFARFKGCNKFKQLQKMNR